MNKPARVAPGTATFTFSVIVASSLCVLPVLGVGCGGDDPASGAYGGASGTGGVSNPGGAPAGTSLANATGGNQTYSGPYGLGRQYALGHEVRPFRRLLSGQAMFRREVFSR